MALDERTRALANERESSFETNPLLEKAKAYRESAEQQGIDLSKYQSPFQGTPSRIKLEDYEDYLPTGGIDPISRDIDEERAQAQTGLELTGKAFGQAATELTLGTLEGIGYLVDAPATVYNGLQGKEEEFDNWWSKTFREAKETINEEWFPIYQTKAAQEGNFLDATSIAGNIKNLMTTLTLMIPATGVARGIGALGKLAKLSPELTMMAQAAGAGIASRASEATMEAQQFLSGNKDALYQEVMSKYQGEVEKELKSLPIAMPYNPESPINYTMEDRRMDEEAIVNKYRKLVDDEVKIKAAEGANKVFQGNAALAILDAFQYAGLFKAFGGIPTKGIGGKVLNISSQMGSEALEEGYQAALGMEALYSEKEGGQFLGPGFSERMGEYLKDGDMQTSMFWGALGGGLFTAAGPLANKAIGQYENVDAALKTAKIKNDLVGKSKIEEDAITSVIMNNAKRNNLDKMGISLATFAQGVTDEYLQENSTTREEFESKLQKIQDNIAYVQEEKSKLDNNKLFEGNELAKLDFVKTKLDSRNNGRIIKEAKDAANAIYEVLEKEGELSGELKTLKSLDVQLNALKQNKANLHKIPSLKKDTELRDRVEGALDKRIANLEPQVKALKESYTADNPGSNLKSELTTSKDEELTTLQNKVQELEIVNTHVVKPRLAAYEIKSKIAEAQEKLKEEQVAADKKAAKENIETATTVEEVEAAAEIAPEEAVTTIENAHKSAAEKEAEGAPEIASERYEGRPNLMLKEMGELGEFEAKDGRTAKIHEVAKQELQALIYAPTVDSFNTALTNILEQAAAGDASFMAVADMLGDFYQSKYNTQLEKTSNEYVVPDNEVEIAQTPSTEELTSNINYQSEQEKAADVTAKKPNRSTITQYMMEKVGNIWKLIKDGGQLKKYLPAATLGINWDFVNNPSSLKQGSDVYFVVDMDKVKHNKDDYHKGLTKADQYINKFAILIAQNDDNGNRQIVGAVPIKYDGTTGKDWNNLLQLRRQIFSMVRDSADTGILDTNLSTKVVYKGNGQLNTTKAKDKPHTRVREGENLVLGIAIEKNGVTTINAGENYPEYNGIPVSRDHAGKVFMLVKGANGSIIPAMCFTSELSNHPELYNKALELLQNTNKDNWAQNREALRKIVYIDYNFNPKTGEFDVFTKEAGGSRKTSYSMDRIQGMLAGRIVQISSSEINKGNYNQKISEEGRLSVDVAQNHVVNANFQFDLNNIATKDDGVKRQATQADLTPETDIDVIPEGPVVAPEVVERSTTSNIPDTPTEPAQLKRPRRTNGTSTNLNIDLDALNRKSTEEFYELWDQQAETDWFKERFGDDQTSLLEVKEGLLNIAKSGGLKAWGQFKEGMAVISSVAKTGTTYHEAFHVVMHLYLNPQQQKAILKEGAKKYNLPLTDKIAIEERIADDFMNYVQAEEADTRGLGKAIKNFFKRIYWMIRERFTSNPTIAEVFHKAQYKYYKTQPFSRDISKFDIVRNRPYDNIYEQHRRTVSLADAMRKSFDSIMQSNSDLESISRKDILSVLTDKSPEGASYKGIEVLAVDAYNSIYDEFLDDPSIAEDKKAAVTKMLSLFLEVGGDGSIVFKELGRKAVQEFANSEGIRIKISDKTVSSFTDSAQNEGVTLMEMGEEETQLEGWQVRAEEMSGKESLSKEVRKELSYIPKLDGNGNILTDDLGFTVYQDFNELYGTLKRDLTDILDSDELITRLEDIVQNKPYLKPLLEKVVTNDLFRTKMFVDFAKSHVEFKVVVQERKYKDDGTYDTIYKLVSANRNNVNNLLIDEWKSNFLDSNSNKTINKDGSINAAKLDAVRRAWDKITNRLKSKSSYSENDLQSIVNGLNYVGVTITLDDIKSIYKTSVTKDGKEYSAKQNIDFFKKDLDLLMNSIIAGNNPFEGESKVVMDISYKVANNRFELMESSFKNTENKTIYSHQIPTFLSKFINKFKKANWEQTIDWYTDTNFYRNSPWLADLRERGARDNFEFIEIDGFKVDGYDKGTRYTSMSPKDYENVTINMFFNNNSKDYVYYRVPVLSDAPKMLFIKFRKYDQEGVVDRLFDVYKQEWARIQHVKNREVQGIKDGIKHYDSEKSKRFLLLPFLNKGNARKAVGSGNEAAIKDAIRQWLDVEASNDFDRLKQLGVLGENADVDSRITNKTNKYGGSEQNFHKDYFYNTILANTQMTSLMSGDPAFYKPDNNKESIYSRTVDYQKRNKQIVSPKLVLDTDASYKLTEEQAAIEGTDIVKVSPDYKTIYINDLEIPSNHAEIIFEALKETGIDDQTAGEIAGAYGYDSKRTVNVTDAQAYITLPRYREVMIGLGRWTKRHQDIYPRLLDGTASGNDLKFIMQPLKPFYFGHSKVGDLVVPVQNKNSEYLLIPQLVKGSPQLEKLYNHMMKNKIASANFESAVKTGLYGAATIENIDQAVEHILNNEDYGLQQETPEHYRDARSLFGSQIRKLIIADIDPNTEFNIAGNILSKDELVDLYQSIIVEDLRDAYEQTSNRFKDIRSIQQLLLEEIRDRNMGEEMEKAVEIVERYNPVTQQMEETFNLPLFHPLHSKRIESLLNAVFKNNVTKQQIKGGSFVQLSSFGFSEELDLVIENGALKYAECKLPWWSKKYFEPLLDDNGQLDIKRVPENLLEMIGYRIPTEDKYSMLPLRVVDFLPASAGGAVMLPMEITTISGSDFDVDKLYIMMPAFEVSEDKQDIRKIKFDYEAPLTEQSKEARDNAKIDIMWEILTSKDAFVKFIKPGGFDTLTNRAKRVLELEGKADEMLPMVLPSTQTELFNRNMAGRALKGIFANHNAHHAVLQFSSVELVGAINLGGETLSSLHNIKNYEDKFISRNVAEFLAAAVDNAKDPVSSFLNINTYTANTVALLVRLGFPIDLATTFLAQPVLKQLSEKYFANGANLQAESKAVAELESSLRGGNKGELNVTISDSPTLAELEKMITGEDSNSDNQVFILRKFLEIKKSANALNDLVRANRADTIGAGPTLAANEKLMDLKEKVLDSTELTGVKELFEGEDYKMIQAFDEYGIERPSGLLGEFFPWMYNKFSETKAAILESIKAKSLTEQQIEQINYELLGFISSGFEFFNGADRSDIINTLPAKFNKLKLDNPEIFSTNLFLKKLLVEEAKDPRYPQRITFRNTGSLNQLERTQVQEAWQELLESPEFSTFANDLVKYTYYTAGFKMTPTSFSHLVPVDFYTGLKDSEGQSFNEFLALELHAAKMFEGTYGVFIDQFYRNNSDATAFVPKIDRELRNITGGMGFIEGKPTYFKVNATDTTTIKDFVLSADKKGAEFSPYVVYKYKGELYLYKNINSANPFIGTYILEEKLGIPNAALEYTKDFDMTSVISNNNPYKGFSKEDAAYQVKGLVETKKAQPSEALTVATQPTITEVKVEQTKTHQDLIDSYELIKEDLEAMGISKEQIPALTEKEAGILLNKFCNK